MPEVLLRFYKSKLIMIEYLLTPQGFYLAACWFTFNYTKMEEKKITGLSCKWCHLKVIPVGI